MSPSRPSELSAGDLARQRSLGMRFDSARAFASSILPGPGDPEIGKVTPELVATFLRGPGALSATWLHRSGF